MSPAQANKLCMAGLEAVEQQCHIHGDITENGGSEPREVDTRNIRIKN